MIMTIKMQRNEVNNDDYGFVARADVYDDHAAVDAVEHDDALVGGVSWLWRVFVLMFGMVLSVAV